MAARDNLRNPDGTPTARRPRRSRARSAFTLIEMLVVLAMVGVIAGMAVPRIDFDRYRVDAAGRVVRNTLQNAQRMAIMRQTNMLIIFDTTGRRMQVVEDANNNNAIDAGERVTNRPLEEGARFTIPPAALAGSALKTVDGNNIRTISSKPTVSFLRDGASSSELWVYVTAGRATPKLFRGLHVTQATGRSEYWRYNGTAWVRSSI
jgi:prepilin-type N-terminal cleavage/methylation domain-containing protein